MYKIEFNTKVTQPECQVQPLQLADTLIGIEEVNLQEVEVSGEGFGLGRCVRFFLQLEETHLSGLCLTLAGDPSCSLNKLNLAHTCITSIQPCLLAKVMLALKDQSTLIFSRESPA